MAFAVDQAVVVGVQEYSPLVAASTLRGCLNDAAGIADALAKDGFKVNFLTNEKATRNGILGALKKLETTSDPKQRFVFYYAGHGRKAPRYALMPSDATADGNDISPKELNDAILRVPARSRTVILDSCFSGGMAAGAMSRGGDDFQGRYFDDPVGRSVKFGVPPAPTNKKDTPEQLETNSGICYYTAALGSEQALEATMPDGKRHGLFTYALLNNLKDGELWGDVHSGVKKTIGKRLENSGRTQNPMISTQYIGAPVLDAPAAAGGTAAKPKPSKTLLEVWNADNPNASKIALILKPDQDVIEAGRRLSLDIQIGQPGFLIIFGQVGDHFYQFYPKPGETAKEAAVGTNTISYPDAATNQGTLYFDDFGADHLKAMLFSDQGAAQAVLDAMQASQGKAQDLLLAQAVDVPAYTSSLSIATSDGLVGGLRFKDLPGLYAKVLAQNTPLTKFLVERMKQAGAGYDKGLSWIGTVLPTPDPAIADKQVFVTLLNLAVQDRLLYEDKAFKGVRLPNNVKKQLKKPPTGDALTALNRAILAAAFPNEVNADDARNR